MYDGDELGATVYTDTKDNGESSQKKPGWAKFDRVDINGLPGATAVNSGSTQARICSAMFDAGKGEIDIQVHTIEPGDQSQCDQALKIAKQIEPKMPKPA